MELRSMDGIYIRGTANVAVTRCVFRVQLGGLADLYSKYTLTNQSTKQSSPDSVCHDLTLLRFLVTGVLTSVVSSLIVFFGAGVPFAAPICRVFLALGLSSAFRLSLASSTSSACVSKYVGSSFQDTALPFLGFGDLDGDFCA